VVCEHEAIQLLCVPGEAVSYNEKAEQVASGRYGRDHPVMESFWRAVAESRQLVRA
jgi:hypothetical protein